MNDSFLSGEKFDFEEYEGKPEKSYIICSTGRSGSTLLCSLLTNTGMMGSPHEYFMAPHAQPLIERFNVPTKPQMMWNDYFDALVRHRTSPNGVFGIKSHFKEFQPNFESKEIQNYFGDLKYIRIHRRNMVAQAISFSIAYQTNQWTSHGTEEKSPVYDFDEINNARKYIENDDSLWQQLLAVNAITPCVVYYEDILDKPSKEIQRVIDFVGVEASISIDLESASLKKQATPLNLEWEERFNREHSKHA
jgi:trehalose 2-sulfotransferase